MRKIILICLILFPTIIYSQKPRVENVHVDVKNTNIIINYDIIDKSESAKFVDLILIDNIKNVYIPDNIYGNVGPNLKKGNNTLKFSMINQQFPLERELSTVIILDHKIKKGPNAALLSVLMPGLGDYFVENPRNIKIKPYYRTVAVGGLLALAVLANNNRPGPIYHETTERVYSEYYNWSAHEWISEWITVTNNYETANPNDYWLFNNDKEIFLGAAISVWVFDIFWVFTKGQRNQKIKSALKNKNYNFAVSGNSFSLQRKYHLIESNRSVSILSRPAGHHC